MELRHLRYFVAVAERLSYRGAADALHIAQPAISQTILDLEAELGATLLARSRRAVRLTPAGEAFLAEAHAILARADDAMRVAQRTARGEAGTLAVGFLGAATAPFLPSLIQKYRARFPRVKIVLSQMTVPEQMAALRDGTIHAAFSRPLSGRGGRDLTEDVVYRDRLVAVLPSKHQERTRPAARVAMLKEEDFVLFRLPGALSLFDAALSLCKAAGFTPHVVSEVDRMQTAVTLVASGVGVSLLPSCSHNLWTRGIVFRRTLPESPPVPLCLVWNPSIVSPTRDAFRDLVAQHHVRIRGQMEKGF